MSTRRLVNLIGVLLIITVVLAAALVYYARDEIAAFNRSDDESQKTAAVQKASGEGTPMVRVSKQAQQGSAIVTRALQVHSLQSRAEIYGGVVNIQSLVEQRARFSAAQNEIRVV